MITGRTYEVFVGGTSVKLVGSTVRTLGQRRRNGYTKQFGPGVELRLIREVPRPEGYSARDFDFYLKACEAMDIARKNAYVEGGGLNKISPLIQALGHQILETERGRIGGHSQPREAKVRGGHNQSREAKVYGGRIGNHEGKACGGHTQGCRNVESGQLARVSTPETRARGGRIRGCEAVESEQLARARARSNCTRWNINRGKPCACGKHLI